jgi:hypothetical protein
MARRDHHDQRAPDPQNIGSLVLALAIAILGTLALVHWMGCSQEAGTALCSAIITPLRTGRWAWLTRLQARVRAACLRTELDWEESALDNMQAALEQLPDDIRHQRAKIGERRIQLMDAETLSRGQA